MLPQEIFVVLDERGVQEKTVVVHAWDPAIDDDEVSTWRSWRVRFEAAEEMVNAIFGGPMAMYETVFVGSDRFTGEDGIFDFQRAHDAWVSGSSDWVVIVTANGNTSRELNITLSHVLYNSWSPNCKRLKSATLREWGTLLSQVYIPTPSLPAPAKWPMRFQFKFMIGEPCKDSSSCINFAVRGQSEDLTAATGSRTELIWESFPFGHSI